MENKNEFITGLFAKKPHENAPKWVIAKLSIKRQDLLNYLKTDDSEYINADLKENQAGKYYITRDNWKPSNQNPSQEQVDQAYDRMGSEPEDIKPSDVPF